ncbi:hypothetical protein [Paraburkholderia hospita]|uniref:IpaJ n=1 Tax=Paraburkholderia hospita TaxID=169430 RepID=A0AAN1JDD1_9BURK|nr:hypothetical protein [Paraburkholderia hospita]AUT71239.1 hypothetical protein C2L64_23345 [Paraburkholderia hospita]EIM96011.1 IpaJ [Paraburkholderia hospita]OUL75449.1 hypothetical protein CA602_36565 [Paraburkholderia hospita]SEI26824.1 hypothetical protein SAMN05192544_10773 [Paraburkholderia hospita]
MTNYKMQQFSALSCGAACLLVAAKEPGIADMPNYPPFMVQQPLALSNGCERAIYAVTANNQQTYSMPDGIALAAIKLGLDVEVYMSGCMVPQLLEWKYPNVRAALGNLNVDVESGTPILKDHQRMLVAVGIGLVGLHWILYRPDTTYMDPAYDKNYTCSLWGMGQLGVFRYIDTGVYVVVSTKGVV